MSSMFLLVIHSCCFNRGPIDINVIDVDAINVINSIAS